MAGKKQSSDRRDETSQEFQNFQRLLEGTLAIPKEQVDKKRAEYERERKTKRKK